MKKFELGMAVRISSLLIGDVILMNLAAFFALFLRFEFRWSAMLASGMLHNMLLYMPIYTVCTVVVFALFKLYNSLWEYASVEEYIHILCASAAASAIQAIGHLLLRLLMPVSYSPSTAILLFLFISAFRFSYRALRRVRQMMKKKTAECRRTMLIGAGAAGATVLREMQVSRMSENRVMCVVDDNPHKIGQYLRGVLIAGNRKDIPELAKKYRIDEIIFAIPTASATEKRDILSICQKTGCAMRTLPGIYQLTNGDVTVQKIRDVQIEDLLGRDEVHVNLDEIVGYLCGKTVLVTGGGGSIGSELCRQIADHSPARLVIFDIYENNAYNIQQELTMTHPELELVVLIGSVRDEVRVNHVFETYHPDIVYHAAAHKHVPLMEVSPNEAIKNNVFGTLAVARAADRYHASTFVMISTDKAVNPTNVMGASKRICEMIVQMMGRRSQTRFVAVRFGNVLGSNGSVIPLFKKQIAAGGPVTVTHKDIIRYFMTIPEAVSLVLQAGAYAHGGEIFVLDMGAPVRIDDLARNMIRLSGFEPDVDIEVHYTGLRPGEKLYEELLMSEEGLQKTPNHLIFVGHPEPFSDEHLLAALDQLRVCSAQNDPEIRSVIRGLVTTYHPGPAEKNAPAAAVKAPAPSSDMEFPRSATTVG